MKKRFSVEQITPVLQQVTVRTAHPTTKRE
jgi:hypothetical protein